MTPAARLQAAIEILEAVINAAREGGAAADTLVQRYFQTRRYAGGGDRRAVRELVFGAVRALGELPASGRAALIGHLRGSDPEMLGLFGSGGHAPEALVPGEPEAVPGLAPAWLMARLRGRFGPETEAEVAALLDRAPLDLRVNRLKADRAAVMAMLPEAEALDWPDTALRMPAGTALETLPAFREGLVEVQDAGSQLAAAIVGARPGEAVVDLCAGAGGKTLALGASMLNKGRIVAMDVLGGRLERAKERFRRAGLHNIETRSLSSERDKYVKRAAGKFDLVLVDAPCSGVGTWRRDPDKRWRQLGPGLSALVPLQKSILDSAHRLVRPGGRLVYATCSLLPEENELQVADFIAAHPDFSVEPVSNKLKVDGVGDFLAMTPGRHDTDGFFAAVLRRKEASIA